jgi:hypothetical protein
VQFYLKNVQDLYIPFKTAALHREIMAYGFVKFVFKGGVVRKPNGKPVGRAPGNSPVAVFFIRSQSGRTGPRLFWKEH